MPGKSVKGCFSALCSCPQLDYSTHGVLGVPDPLPSYPVTLDLLFQQQLGCGSGLQSHLSRMFPPPMGRLEEWGVPCSGSRLGWVTWKQPGLQSGGPALAEAEFTLPSPLVLVAVGGARASESIFHLGDRSLPFAFKAPSSWGKQSWSTRVWESDAMGPYEPLVKLPFACMGLNVCKVEIMPYASHTLARPFSFFLKMK